MSARNASHPVSRQQASRGSRHLRPAFTFIILSVAFVLSPLRAAAFELRLTTENDLLVESERKDDLYTFAVGIEVERGPYTLTLHENAFTDRRARLRFDETQLTVSRPLPGLGRWDVQAGAGVVHVGRGIFGQEAQNAVHDAIGSDQVHLPYEEPSWHARVALGAERSFDLGERLAVGPRLEADAIPGLRSHAVLGAQVHWRPQRAVAVDVLAGARLTDASLPALERRLEKTAPIARVGVLLLDRIVLSWTYNDYGDEREHLSLGYRLNSSQWRRSR